MTSKKSPNVYKSCPSSLEKLKVLTPFQKLHKNMVDLGKIFVATGFENSSKAQLNRPIWSHWLACVTTTNCHIQPSVGSWALINGSRKRARMRTRLLRFIFPQKSWVENTIIIIIWARNPEIFPPTQSDQMARLFVQHLAVYNSDNWPKSINFLQTLVQNFGKVLNKPLEMANDF